MFDPYDFLDSLSDDELAALEMGGGGGLDPYLFPMLSLIEPLPVQYSTAKWNFGAEQPYSIDTYAKQNNAFQDDLQIFADPLFGLYGAALGLDTVDFNQFVPQQPQIPEPVVFTPTLDSLRMDETTADIAAMIEQGMPLSTVRSAIREANISSEEVRQDLLKDAERAWVEKQNAERSMLEYQQQVANAPQQLTPMQIAAQRAGLPDPLATWDPSQIDMPMGFVADQIRLDEAIERDTADAARHQREAERYRRQAENARRRLERARQNEPSWLPWGSSSRRADRSGSWVAKNVVEQAAEDPTGPLAERYSPIGRGRGAHRARLRQAWAESGLRRRSGSGSRGRGGGRSGSWVADSSSRGPSWLQGPPITPRMREEAQRAKSAELLAASHADWSRRAAKDAARQRAEKERSNRARRLAEVIRRTQAGDTPFNRVAAQRMALMRMIHGR